MSLHYVNPSLIVRAVIIYIPPEIQFLCAFWLLSLQGFVCACSVLVRCLPDASVLVCT